MTSTNNCCSTPKLRILLEGFNKMSHPILAISFTSSGSVKKPTALPEMGCCGNKMVKVMQSVGAASAAIQLMGKHCVDIACPPVLGVTAAGITQLLNIFKTSTARDEVLSIKNVLRGNEETPCCLD